MNDQQRQDSLEARLQALLDQYHRTPDPAAQRQLADAIVAELIPYFYEFLRGYVAKSLDPSVVDKNRDQSLGFTALLNEAYLKLKKTESLNWQVSSVKGLRAWFIQVLRRMLMDYHRRKKSKKGRPLESLSGKEAEVPTIGLPRTGQTRPGEELDDPVIGPYFEICRQHVQQSFGVPVPEMLEELEVASLSEDEEVRLYVRVLEEHYIAGTPWEDLAEILEVSRSSFFALKKRAIEWLKERLKQRRKE